MQLIQSGEWQTNPQMHAYRSEWLSGLLVERAEWVNPAGTQRIRGRQISGPDYVWFRFWLPNPRQIVDKYFDASGQAIGLYLPVSEPIQASTGKYSTHHLFLGLWLLPTGQMTVMGEPSFEDALESGAISSSQAVWAEKRIRELTLEIYQERMPPSLIRNFAIEISPVEKREAYDRRD